MALMEMIKEKELHIRDDFKMDGESHLIKELEEGIKEKRKKELI